MNNKGFMMAEVIVVAAVILVTMVGLYASYNKVFTVYNQRVDYYDVTTLYELGSIREKYKDELSSIGSTGTVLNEDNRQVYYVDVIEITDMVDDNNLNLTFRDYLKFLSTSLEVSTDSILVMEKCIDSDNCKYAYLEVFE